MHNAELFFLLQDGNAVIFEERYGIRLADWPVSDASAGSPDRKFQQLERGSRRARRLFAVITEDVNGSLARRQTWCCDVQQERWSRNPGLEWYPANVTMGTSRADELYFSDEYGRLTVVGVSGERWNLFPVGGENSFAKFFP